jgi:hypothetical protein
MSWWSITGTGTLDIGYGGTFLSSQVVADGPDRLRITSPLGDAALPCHSEAVGTYRWQLAMGGTRLEMQVLEDTCAPRAAFLAGTWSKGSCEIASRACMGLLEAGRYETGAFDPRGGPEDPPLARMGAFSFEVPDGWASAEENLSSYELTTAEGYSELVSRGRSGAADAIRIAAQPVALQPYRDPDCAIAMDGDAERATVGLADWLRGHPGLVVAGQSDVTIDGHPGIVLDLDIAPASGSLESCLEGVPLVPLFANGAAFGPDGAWFDDMVYGDHWVAEIGGGPTDPVRVILLDLDGDPLVILIDSFAPADQAAFVGRAMPVVESFEFPR